MRNQDTLIASQPARLTDGEEALDLLVDAANGLHIAKLVHRTGDGQGLTNGDPAQRGKQGIQLGGRGTVAVDAAIRLLEDKASVQRKWIVGGVVRA